MRKFLNSNPEALAGIEKPEAFVSELQAMQRIFHLTPSENKYGAAKVLWKNKLHSAYAIKMAGESTVNRLFPGQPKIGKKIFQKASFTQMIGQTFNLMKAESDNLILPLHARS